MSLDKIFPKHKITIVNRKYTNFGYYELITDRLYSRLIDIIYDNLEKIHFMVCSLITYVIFQQIQLISIP